MVNKTDLPSVYLSFYLCYKIYLFNSTMLNIYVMLRSSQTR